MPLSRAGATSLLGLASLTTLMKPKDKVHVTPTQRNYAATITPEGLYCTRTYFFPWSLLETKVTKHVLIQATGHETDCWIYQGSLDADGYGRVRIQSVYIRVHRLMWLARFGLIPDDLVVCHNCDQPSCCRPEHLRLDTSPENIRERTRKGRTARGVTNAHHKLNDELVRELRSLHPSLNYRQLGRRFGVAHGTARLIVKRVWWKHVA